MAEASSYELVIVIRFRPVTDFDYISNSIMHLYDVLTQCQFEFKESIGLDVVF